MTATIVFFALVCLLMIAGILFFPKIGNGRLSLDSYWVITLIGAIILFFISHSDIKELFSAITADSSVNPLKILILFISMTELSIFLDELGFFSYLASITLRRARTSQKKLFLYLYLIVSLLTVFTSNDIIILSFTPFICCFAKNANISPLPYLAAEFTAANTWSMALIIGNPTNIYLSSAFGINFVGYLKVMLLPTLAAGIVAFLMLYILFGKKLSEKLEPKNTSFLIKDKLLLVIGIFHLCACTLLLAIGSYIGLEMWLVSFISFLSLFTFVLLVSIFRRRKPKELLLTLKRAPWQLIPFILSMFSMIIMLGNSGVTDKIAELLPGGVFSYGAASFLSSNIINNIPMSVLFCSIIDCIKDGSALSSVFATIVGSNLGALLTPIGALAGIMWSSILTKNSIKYRYTDFLKTGIIVGIPALLSCLFVLSIIV